MSRFTSRRVAVVTAGIAAVPLLGLSVAWACTSLATIDMDHQKGAVAGETIHGTGQGFSQNPTSSDVQVHLDGRNGPLLASAKVDVNGRVAFEFTTPQAAAGDHVVVATQTNAQGQPVGGTPARAPLTINAAQSAPAPAQPAAPPARQTQPAPQAVPAQAAPAAPAPA
ncbi:MAG: hypothetical protein LC779_14325, partial [Actinobacteria bacterium]|nr:hypothetical protein [Actinomycetota bacterium]